MSVNVHPEAFLVRVGQLLSHALITVARSLLVRVVHRGLHYGLTFRLLNRVYNHLDYEGKRICHGYLRDLFIYRTGVLAENIWRVEFCGRELLLPLRSDSLALDWELALSVLGHDVEIKSTYERLLRSSQAPRVFLDVGSNFGTHTFLFALCGVETVSFEPNPHCYSFYQLVCTLNKLSPSLREFGLSDSQHQGELSFPPEKTWNGTTVKARKGSADAYQRLEHITVRLETLDSLAVPDQLCILKIDTEGLELSVLRGAELLLRRGNVIIVFESERCNSPRNEIFSFLGCKSYGIFELNSNGTMGDEIVEREHFMTSPSLNFLSLPHTLEEAVCVALSTRTQPPNHYSDQELQDQSEVFAPRAQE